MYATKHIFSPSINQILFGGKKKSNDHEASESESKGRKEFIRRRRDSRADYLRLPRPRGRSRRFPVASGRTTHAGRRVAGGDRPAWHRTTNSGAAGVAVRCIVAVARSLARFVLLVDDSRLRRYNCGLRSETRGNPRERRFLRLCAYRRVRACIRVSTLHRVCATSRGNPYLRAKGKRKRGRRTKSDTKAIHPKRGAAPPINPFFFRVFPPTWP